MTIIREIFGKPVEIELTDNEIAACAAAHGTNTLCMEDAALALIEYANLYADCPDHPEDHIAECMEEYHDQLIAICNQVNASITGWTIDSEPYNTLICKAIAAQRIDMPEREYEVTFAITYSGSVNVKAKDRNEAERKAWLIERDCDYVPQLGSTEVIDVNVIDVSEV